MAASRRSIPLTESLRSAEDKGSSQSVRFTRGRLLVAACVVLILVAGAGLWSNHAVRESVEELLTANLEANLNVSATALTAWIENELALVRFWAREERLRHFIETLQRGGPGRTSRQALRELLAEGFTAKEVMGWGIVDPEGTIVASDVRRDRGRMTADTMRPHLARVFAGRSVFVPPKPVDDIVEDPVKYTGQSFMLTIAPVRNQGGAIIAALAFAIRPDGHFNQILLASRMGAAGDTYAFNRQGYLISKSRFEADLRSFGLIPDDTVKGAIPELLIRDPGGDLSTGFTPNGRPEDWPSTRMLASALRGESGIDLDGYRDYRGVAVVGAWRWLPDYDFGIAIEVPREKVHRIQRPIRRAVIGLMVLVTLLAGLILLSTLWVSRLRADIDEIKQVGHYTIHEKLGEGGMGKVYKATHALLKRPTAIKFLKPDALTADSLERFEREVQITSRLTHPNTIDVYDFGRTPEGVFYYAMEYLPGISLSDLIALDGTVSSPRVIHILRHICFSLEEAHGMGLIHRDIKPPNIILCERGGQYDSVKVLDFGLVKDVKQHDVQMTAMHEVAGTPAYVAPERLTDPAKVDHRADIYSLGSVAFNLLTGMDVFEGATAVEICYHVMKTPPPKISDKTTQSIPVALNDLVDACLAKNPDERPPDVTRIIAILDAIEGVSPWGNTAARKWWQANEARIQSLKKPAA